MGCTLGSSGPLDPLPSLPLPSSRFSSFLASLSLSPPSPVPLPLSPTDIPPQFLHSPLRPTPPPPLPLNSSGPLDLISPTHPLLLPFVLILLFLLLSPFSPPNTLPLPSSPGALPPLLLPPLSPYDTTYPTYP